MNATGESRLFFSTRAGVVHCIGDFDDGHGTHGHWCPEVRLGEDMAKGAGVIEIEPDGAARIAWAGGLCNINATYGRPGADIRKDVKGLADRGGGMDF
jgi:hypothetical protein